MEITLSAVHIIYVLAIAAIIGCMCLKRDTSVVCILGIFAVGLAATSSAATAVGGVFNSFVFAINELAGTILIISVITALCKLLEVTGINERMVSPVTRLIKTPNTAFWLIGLVMMAVSTFFWPSPAVALIGAVFLPVGLKAKLPAMGVAVAMNLFGHGIALSGDLVIQGAPKLTAAGAGIETAELVAASLPLVLVMGLVTTAAAFYFLKRDMKSGRLALPDQCALDEGRQELLLLPNSWVRLFALLVPLAFALDVAIMFAADLQGGDATALIGGTALLILLLLAAVTFKGKSFDRVTEYLVEGFLFGFRVFGPVIPIAAFFFLGDSALAAVLGEAAVPAGSSGLVNDLGLALSEAMPMSKGISAVTSTLVGTLTGLDGSGFSGLNLAGSVAKIFAVVLGRGAATLAALGQIAGIWVGGGTIIPWAVIPVAAICNVSPIELAGRNIKPVVIGLAVTTVVGMLLL